MDLRKLKTLIELVEASGIAELEISEGEERVRITRTVASGQQMYAPAPQQQIMAAPVAAA
ncbi:MAG: acetyl-CoA carboxylase biotin carboxyl carrier protein, partial [Gallionella sp.]|nr:acetyl-CoA carboxylase biotin carboxyl carrier protein [Gallionella sp.]